MGIWRKEFFRKVAFHNNCDVHQDKETVTQSYEDSTILTKILIYISFFILQFVGNVNEIFFPCTKFKEKYRNGYLPLCDKFLAYYLKYIVNRIIDCWSFPICSVAGAIIELKKRERKCIGEPFRYTGSTTKCINLASYNYLGFAEASGPCAKEAIKSIYIHGISTGSTRQKYGTCAIHNELEKLLADFFGTEDAVTFGMGFATNTLNIPLLMNPECLVLSDEKNHNSLILGIRMSGAEIKIFKHNDVSHLERLLKEAIYYGQPILDKKFKQWKKIFIFIEGIYSMEGTICKLPEIITLKKKYKAYLYLDEAHSCGALGKSGRGVVEYFRCDPNDVDIRMGTFSKNFGSIGGFMAGKKKLITFIREHSYASRYAWAIAPPLCAQVISSLKIIIGKDGTNEGLKRIIKLARNTRYVRKKMEQMGLIVYGHEDSPVVPVLVFFLSKIAALTRTLIKKNIAIIGVGYPATPLTEVRIRICISCVHRKEQLDYALEILDKMADELGLRYSRKVIDKTPIIY